MAPTTNTATKRPAAPARTAAQRTEALKKANVVRSERATIKRELKAGRRNIGDLLRDPPEVIHTMKVVDILMCVPKYGRVKVGRILQKHKISPSKTISGLSPRQRRELIDALRPG